MADIALVCAYSHSPYLFAPPTLWPQVRARIRQGKPLRADLPREAPQELEAKYRRSREAFDRLCTLLHQSGAEVLLLIGDDQKELFRNLVAGFIVYTGARVAGPKLPGRVREVTGQQDWLHLANHRSLAEQVLQGLLKAGFDVAFFDAPENPEVGFGHAFLPPLPSLMPALELPVVPLLVNCYYPPQPSPRRCYQLGEALRAVLHQTSVVQRVAVGVSGGLWHTPGHAEATIDEEFDRAVLAALATGKGQTLAALPEEQLVSGTGEVRNWIVAAGLTAARPWQIVDYIPLYYSPIGLGFAACVLDGTA